MTHNGLVVGIDASRNRSGGAKAHIIGILEEGDPLKYGIKQVHVWSFNLLLNSIPDYPWLVKHNPRELELSLPKQLLWQATKLKDELRKSGCQILFSTDASTFCRFKPNVVLSQDMLSYEPGIMRLFGFSKERLRLFLILLVQNRAFRYADGVIFLTKYAGELIQRSCGLLSNVEYIPHGVARHFKLFNKMNKCQVINADFIKCVYVSNADMYKHQWVVVSAIAVLRQKGYNLSLTLVGGGSGNARKILDKQINISDPNAEFVKQKEYVSQHELPLLLSEADVFIFASSCENMPVTLIEGMSIGLPIACSNRGPMPEVLSDAGIYFDPEEVLSIVAAVEKIISNTELSELLGKRAKNLSALYSWSRCADETWAFIKKTYNMLENGKK